MYLDNVKNIEEEDDDEKHEPEKESGVDGKLRHGVKTEKKINKRSRWGENRDTKKVRVFLSC
jgi:hypothetical protein